MMKKNTLWLPGTDHASIATEAKVTKMLKDKGIDKKQIDRDKFIEHAWDWTHKYGGIIINQLKKKKNLIDCCTTWLKQPRCLIVRRKQFHVLFKVGVYPCFNWVAAYAFHAQHLTNGYANKPAIIWGAWGRCVLQKERSHVSL